MPFPQYCVHTFSIPNVEGLIFLKQEDGEVF